MCKKARAADEQKPWCCGGGGQGDIAVIACGKDAEDGLHDGEVKQDAGDFLAARKSLCEDDGNGKADCGERSRDHAKPDCFAEGAGHNQDARKTEEGGEGACLGHALPQNEGREHEHPDW